MKTSINAWSCNPESGFEEMFAEVKAAGFDGIELNVDAPGGKHALSLETTDEELAEIKAISEKYQLPVVSISSSQHAGMWGDNDPTVREKAKNVLRAQIRCAKALGATGVLMVPGGMCKGRSLLTSWKNSVTAMKEMASEVEASGIIAGVENVWNAFFTSPFDMLRFLEEVGSPAYQVYFDMGNMHAFSSTEHWAEILAGHVDKIHVKGYRRNRGSINQGGVWCDITEDDINWAEAIPYVKAGGFDGYLTAEVGKSDAEQSWADYYRMVRGQVAVLCSYAE